MKQGKWYVSRMPNYENWRQSENKKIARHQLLITGIPFVVMVLLVILA